jgi:DNA mismatch endonuclease (patch repair protein)
MPDIVSKKKRSEMMAGIRGKHTKPEMLVRSILHKAGFRFRLHTKHLPGKPDLVLPKYHAAILINGCFWHGHDCHLFKWPSSKKEFWRNKILKNRANDEKTLTALDAQDWRVLVIWECALKGKEKRSLERIVDEVTGWLHSDETYHEIKGRRGKN